MNNKLSLVGVAMVLWLASLACSVSGVEDSIRVTKTEDTNDGKCTIGDCSLREAVVEANERDGADKITVPEGLYLLTIAGGGLPVITDDVIIEGAGLEATVIDGNVDLTGASVFRLDHNIKVEITDLTVRNSISATAGGAFQNPVAELEIRNVFILGCTAGIGGAIYNRGTLTLDNVTINANKANGVGGGIYSVGDSKVTMQAVRFVSNRAEDKGGAIYTEDDVDILDDAHFGYNTAGSGGALFIKEGANVKINGSNFEGNRAENLGGAIYNEAILSVRESQLIENQAQTGGAVYNGFTAQIEVFDTNFQDNVAAGAGGALHNSQGVILLTRSSLIGNRASDGAGAYNGANSVMQFINSTISANRDTNRGAGILNSGGQLFVRFSTIFNNAPHSGIYVLYGDVFIRDTIVAGNQGGNCTGELTSEGHNLKGDNTCGAQVAGDIIQSNAVLSGLVQVGSTYAHPLDVGSPAIDAGNNLNCPDEDQHLQARPQDGNEDGVDTCDIGAFEYMDLAAIPFENSTPTPLVLDESPPVVNEDTLCWAGPGSAYEVISSLQAGTTVELLGVGETEGWLVIANPLYNVPCWVGEDDLDLDPNLDLNDLEVFPAPPLPTATFTPAPVITPTKTPAANSGITGVVGVDGGGTGFGNVTVDLRPGGCNAGVSQSVKTNGSGNYTFSGLQAGTYCVRVDISTLPPGNWVASAPPFPIGQSPTREVTVGANELLSGVNFGFQTVIE